MNQISLLVANYRDTFTLPAGSKILAVHRASLDEIVVWVSSPAETNPRFYYYRVCSDQENVW